MSLDLHQLFDDAGRTPPRAQWDADDVVRRGRARRLRRRATTVTASVAATALVVVATALLASPGTVREVPPATSSEPPATTAASTPTPAPSTPSASTPAQLACRASDIDLALGTGGIAAGTSYRAVVASPVKGRSCALDGYPTVTLADAAGTVVGSPAVRNEVAAVHPVLVGAGRASFLLGFAETANFAAAACSPVTVTTLRVALPGDPTVISLPLPAGTLTCSRDVSALGAPLDAGPWVPGSTGQ